MRVLTRARTITTITTITTAAAVALVTGPALPAAGVPPASAAAARTGCDPSSRVQGDLDGDGRTDAVVPMPDDGDGAGTVDIRYTAHRSVALESSRLSGDGSGEGSRFGLAVAVADLDRDGCADLLIGAPHIEESSLTDSRHGQVYLLRGSPSGLRPGDAVAVPHAIGRAFGASLAVVARGTGPGGVHDVFVGAPDSTAAGHPGAGRVMHYTMAPAAGGGVAITYRGTVTQDSPGVPDASEDYDGFGETLAPLSAGLAVGAPREDVGRSQDAGAIWYLQTGPDGGFGQAQMISQTLPGMTGPPMNGFGDVIAGSGRYLAIGLPYAAAGGLVELLRVDDAGALVANRTISAAGPGVPGPVQKSAGFGAAVVFGRSLLCSGGLALAIGSPGSTVAGVRGAGAVAVVPVGSSSCRPRLLTQADGLHGGPERNDNLGAALGVTRSGGRSADRLLVGIMNESVGRDGFAGMVVSPAGPFLVAGRRANQLIYSKGSRKAEFYGTAFAVPAS